MLDYETSWTSRDNYLEDGHICNKRKRVFSIIGADIANTCIVLG